MFDDPYNVEGVLRGMNASYYENDFKMDKASCTIWKTKYRNKNLLGISVNLGHPSGFDSDRLKKDSYAKFFENLVVDLLLKMGYGGSLKDSGSVIGGSHDEGIDGLIKEDRLGLDVIYIQAKKWDSTIGRPEIQKFVGALQGQRAKKGIFITTSDFNENAYSLELCQRSPISSPLDASSLSTLEDINKCLVIIRWVSGDEPNATLFSSI